MSHQRKSWSNGNCKNVADLEKEAAEIEKNLENLNKSLINRVIRGLSSIMFIVQRKEMSIFKLILKWFRLYLQIHISINPDDKLLLKYYENTVPTVISYIIGCLQYNTKEIINYHFNLLEIFEDLLKNIPTNVLKKLKHFEIGTIGCLWQPIDLAGDFNTQLKALKILSQLLKHFDEARQNEELRSIKWTNLNLFQDKLKTIVQETKLQHVLENNSRDLLNNYNMNLSKNIMVYSFYCSTVVLDHKYKFYKLLNHEKFWIDINYRPQTLTYKARFKLNRNSKYEDITAILKIEKMKLENNLLIIYFQTPAEFSKFSELFSNIKENVIQFKLNKEETKRLKANDFIIEYFNRLNDKINSFNILKNEMITTLKDVSNKTSSSKIGSKLYKSNYHTLIDSTPERNSNFKKGSVNLNARENNVYIESPKTSRSTENIADKHPIRELRNRKKFFTSLLENDSDNEIEIKKPRKRRTQNKKTRQLKSNLKQVCKVTPTVDLTKMDLLDTKENLAKSKKPKENEVKKSAVFISSQECAEVLQQVSDVYKVTDNSYAKPCQSYRNFKMDTNPLSLITNKKDYIRSNRRKNKLDIKNESFVEKKRKVMANCYDQIDKENINPENPTISKNTPPSRFTKRIISPHLFETQRSTETSPSKISRLINEKNIEIDLTIDEENAQKTNHDKENNHSLFSGSDCEEVRGLNDISLKEIEHICTPTKSILNYSSVVNTPTPSAMNISDLNDSDMEVTQIINKHSFFDGKLNERENPISEKNDILDMEITNITNKETNHNEVINVGYVEIENILKDFDSNTIECCNILNSPNKNGNLLNVNKPQLTNDRKVCDYNRDCVVFRKRLDSNDSQSSEDDNVQDFFNKSENSSNQSLAIVNEMPLNLTRTNEKYTTPDKDDNISSNVITTMTTKCQVTPTAIIMHQIQVSAKKSVIYRREHIKKDLKVNKCLSNYYKSIEPGEKLTESIKQTKTLQNHDSEISKEMITNRSLHLKQPKVLKTNLPYQINKYNKTYSNEIQKYSENPDYRNCNQLIDVETIIENLSDRNENVKSSSENSYIYDTPSTNSFNEELLEDVEENLQENSSPFSSHNIEDNLMNSLRKEEYRSYNHYRNMEGAFKTDFIQILNQHNAKIQLRLKKFHENSLKNMSSLYTRKFCEIAQVVLKKSDEQRIELEQIRQNIGHLVRELQGQYNEFINKYKEFDVHKELTKQILETIINLDMTNTIKKDYEDQLQNIYKEQQEIIEKLLQKYLKKYDH